MRHFLEKIILSNWSLESEKFSDGEIIRSCVLFGGLHFSDGPSYINRSIIFQPKDHKLKWNISIMHL